MTESLDQIEASLATLRDELTTDATASPLGEPAGEREASRKATGPSTPRFYSFPMTPQASLSEPGD